jgi:hypothetical protein
MKQIHLYPKSLWMYDFLGSLGLIIFPFVFSVGWEKASFEGNNFYIITLIITWLLLHELENVY